MSIKLDDRRSRSHSVPETLSPVINPGAPTFVANITNPSVQPMESQPCKYEESPLEIAQRQNQQLLAAYKQRMQKADKYQSTSLVGQISDSYDHGAQLGF